MSLALYGTAALFHKAPPTAPPLFPNGIDRAHGIRAAHHGRGELCRRVVKGVDDHGVVQPEPQTHSQNQGHHADALQTGDDGFVDLAHEMEVSPRHDVDDRQRDDRGLEDGCQARGVIADVGGQLAVEPAPKCRKESHVVSKR